MKTGSFFLMIVLVLLSFSACKMPSGSTSGSTVDYVPVTGANPGIVSILSASLASPSARGIVNRFNHTISFYLPGGSSLSSLTPSFVTASGVTVVSPTSPLLDLSSPVIVSLSDGSSYTMQAFATTPSAAVVDGWIGSGINLGNDLDAWPGAEGSWTNGVVAQEYFFDDYVRMGLTSARVPVTWGMATNPADRLDSVSPYNVNPSFMGRVDTVVGWGIDAGMTVVVNAHHENWIRTLTGSALTAQLPRFEALWSQIATHFVTWPPQLVFEIINEPQGAMTDADVNTLNNAILPIIRGTGGFNKTRIVIIGANNYNSMYTLQDGVFSVPSDPYVIVNFHNYNPWTFAGESMSTWGSSSDIASMTSDFNNVASWSQTKGAPLYMGEYGVTFEYNGAKTDLPSRALWYKNMRQLAKSKGIAMTFWDDYGDFKIYDRVNRSYDNSVIPTVIQ
jgi:endoglucanase